MALIKCPDCGKDVSSNAESFLHSGCPIKKKETVNKSDSLPIDIFTSKFCYVIMAAAYIVYLVVNEATCGLICCIVFTSMSIIPLVNTIVREKYDDNLDFIIVIIIRGIVALISIICFIGFAGAGFTW